VRRPLLLALACFAFAAAVLIVAAAGLPERAAFTGVINPGDTRSTAPEIGAFAPPFAASLLDGDTLSLNSLRGSPVILNFWATWCEPCEVEMPELQAFYEAYPQVHLIGINLAEPPALIHAWMDARGLNFPTVLDLDGRIARDYALRGQPTTYILSPNGVIAHIFFGVTTRAALENVVLPLIVG